MSVTVWFHDPTEVDPDSSWTGLVPALTDADYRDIKKCTIPAVTELFEYARPDAVVDVDGQPVVSIEQTAMNPSGHNLPQRFSCLLKAAECGVMGVLYHPEYSRRTFASGDMNPRYANPRVALAQFRMDNLFVLAPPSLSVFWPTDDATMLPATGRAAQANMAGIVAAAIETGGAARLLRVEPAVMEAQSEMRRAIDAYGPRIGASSSFRDAFPAGLVHAQTSSGLPVDPPPKAVFIGTPDLLAGIVMRFGPLTPRGHAALPRITTLHFKATANKSRTDSEHPWPGYFALLDILYSRTGAARSDRLSNMVYELPIPLATWVSRMPTRPAAMRIADAIADMVILEDAVVLGGALDAGTAVEVVASRGR